MLGIRVSIEQVHTYKYLGQEVIINKNNQTQKILKNTVDPRQFELQNHSIVFFQMG